MKFQKIAALLAPVLLIAGCAKLSDESRQIAACAGLDAVEVKLEGQGEVRHGTAVVKYKGSCDASRTKVALLKEDGKWKIGAGK